MEIEDQVRYLRVRIRVRVRVAPPDKPQGATSSGYKM